MSRAPGDRKRSTRESCLPGAGRIRRSRRHEDLGCAPEAPTDEDKTMTDAELDQLSVNTIRTLSIDAVERAKSGHPGTPMALAPLVYTIWNRVMRFDPQDPIWPNRDRFVLSNGHASMLLWSVLHLTGTRAVNADYERLGQPSVSLEDVRSFRQIGSKAPGHPEYHWVSGVETTTGPLGQGVATSVGMAIAQKWLAARYNRPGFAIFDYGIYVVCGDGCLMEGIGSEAASLAGHLGLDNLCWVYDNNHIYAPAAGVARGAYVLADPAGGNPEVILIASGSELNPAVEAHGTLVAEGIRSRVASMPSWEIFERQTPEYRDQVLPPGVTARVAVEQGSTF